MESPHSTRLDAMNPQVCTYAHDGKVYDLAKAKARPGKLEVTLSGVTIIFDLDELAKVVFETEDPAKVLRAVSNMLTAAAARCADMVDEYADGGVT